MEKEREKETEEGEILLPYELEFSDLLLLSSDEPSSLSPDEIERLEFIKRTIMENLGPTGPGLLSITGVPIVSALRRTLLPLARKLALLNFEDRKRVLKANAIFGRLRPRHINAESDEETLRRENNLLKATLVRERNEHEANLHVNESLQRELAQTKGDLRETYEVLSSVREELKTTKASEQKLANMNIRFVAETESLKTTNEGLAATNQNLSIQLGEVQTKARGDRKIHRAKRRKLRGKIKVLEERDPPLTEELRKQIQADYRASDELGVEILKVYYEGYEDCRERGKEKLAAAQLDPALIDSEGEGGA